MENKTFLNGVNFINTVMAMMTTGQEVSLPGYDRVLAEIVDPGLDPRCNGDCVDCPYFVIDGDDGDDDTGETV